MFALQVDSRVLIVLRQTHYDFISLIYSILNADYLKR